jgi:hypothetical protein
VCFRPIAGTGGVSGYPVRQAVGFLRARRRFPFAHTEVSRHALKMLVFSVLASRRSFAVAESTIMTIGGSPVTDARGHLVLTAEGRSELAATAAGKLQIEAAAERRLTDQFLSKQPYDEGDFDRWATAKGLTTRDRIAVKLKVTQTGLPIPDAMRALRLR